MLRRTEQLSCGVAVGRPRLERLMGQKQVARACKRRLVIAGCGLALAALASILVDLTSFHQATVAKIKFVQLSAPKNQEPDAEHPNPGASSALLSAAPWTRPPGCERTYSKNKREPQPSSSKRDPAALEWGRSKKVRSRKILLR